TVRFKFRLVELNTRREKHSVAEKKCFPSVEKGQNVCKTRQGVRHQAANYCLITLIGQTQSQKIVTLTEDSFADVRRPLAHYQQRKSILPPFFCNPLKRSECLSLNCISVLASREIQMRLIAK